MRKNRKDFLIIKKGGYIAFGIGIERTNCSRGRVGNLNIFLGNYYWQRLVNRGKTETRYGSLGSKVGIVNVDQGEFFDRMSLSNLKFYVENKKNLKI